MCEKVTLLFTIDYVESTQHIVLMLVPKLAVSARRSRARPQYHYYS